MCLNGGQLDFVCVATCRRNFCSAILSSETAAEPWATTGGKCIFELFTLLAKWAWKVPMDVRRQREVVGTDAVDEIKF